MKKNSLTNKEGEVRELIRADIRRMRPATEVLSKHLMDMLPKRKCDKDSTKLHNVSFTKTSLHFALADGREISAPFEWFPRLRDASNKERNNWRFIANGIGVHWPDIDEDIAVRTLLAENYYWNKNYDK